MPSETPSEGPNIGLIDHNYLWHHKRKYGFIETPYRKVDKETGVVTEIGVDYLSADELMIVAQANEPSMPKVTVKQGCSNDVKARSRSPKRKLSTIWTFLPSRCSCCYCDVIPFLENDDANRADGDLTCRDRLHHCSLLRLLR